MFVLVEMLVRVTKGSSHHDSGHQIRDGKAVMCSDTWEGEKRKERVRRRSFLCLPMEGISFLVTLNSIVRKLIERRRGTKEKEKDRRNKARRMAGGRSHDNHDVDDDESERTRNPLVDAVGHRVKALPFKCLPKRMSLLFLCLSTEMFADPQSQRERERERQIFF